MMGDKNGNNDRKIKKWMDKIKKDGNATVMINK